MELKDKVKLAFEALLKIMVDDKCIDCSKYVKWYLKLVKRNDHHYHKHMVFLVVQIHNLQILVDPTFFIQKK